MQKHIVCHVCVLRHFGRVRLFVTLRTIARQAPPAMGFSRRECWSGPCPPPGLSPAQGWTPRLLRLLHWQEGSLALGPSPIACHTGQPKPWQPSSHRITAAPVVSPAGSQSGTGCQSSRQQPPQPHPPPLHLQPQEADGKAQGAGPRAEVHIKGVAR